MNDVIALTAAAAFASLCGVFLSGARLIRRERAERHLVKKIAEIPSLKNCLNPRCNIDLPNDAWVCLNCGRTQTGGDPRAAEKIADQQGSTICPNCNIALSNFAPACGNCGRPLIVGEPGAVGGRVNVSILGVFNLVIPEYKDLVTKVLTRELIPSEQKAILMALEQPSVGGQQEYILKLLKQVGKYRTQLSRQDVH